MANALEEPRSLPTTGFKGIEADQRVEEEELPDYKVDRFYPVRLGEVFQGQIYQHHLSYRRLRDRRIVTLRL